MGRQGFRPRKDCLRHLPRACFLLIPLLLGSCIISVGPGAQRATSLKLTFRLQGLPSARTVSSGASSRLLLPTASTLTVSLVPQSSSIEGPADQVVSIDSTKTVVDVSFQNVIRGLYTLRAQATDASNTVLFVRQIDLDLRNGNGPTAPLYLIPAAGDVASVNFVSGGATIAAGASKTWLCPSTGGYFSADCTKASGLEFYLQDPDGLPLTLDSNTLSYDFGGAASNGSQYFLTVYNPSSSQIACDFSLNATFTLSFDSNASGTSSPPTSMSGRYHALLALPDFANGRTGYNFQGWGTAAAGPVAYTAGAQYPMGSGDTTFYAQWSIGNYTVVFDPNGGTGNLTPQTIAYNTSAALSANTFTRTGYSFAGWNTAANGTGTAYADKASYLMSSKSVTLYAQWTANSYAVTFDANNGAGTMTPQSIVFGSSAALSANSFTRTGYSFTGWNTASGGTGTSYADKASFTMSTTGATLYAQWTTLPTYTVSYQGNTSTSGSPPSDANAYLTGATVTVLGNTGSLAKTGSTFVGWNTQAGGGGTSYSAAATFAMGSANVTLYAQWTTLPTYTVSYQGNTSTSGSPPSDANAYLTGATVTVLGNTGSLAKTGSTFVGWNTQAGGGGTSYSAAATFAMGSANVTLYAQWTTLPTYTVSYQGNTSTSGSPPSDANAYLTGATVTVLGNTGSLANTGSTFAGWNTQAGGGGTSYASGDTFAMGSANVTLYAQWTTLPTYTVSYQGNTSTSGSPPSDANAYLQGATVTVLGNTGSLAKTGSTFVGWNTQAGGGGTSYSAAATFPMGSANVTLYAQWTTLPTYTVSYQGNTSTSGSPPSDANAYLQGATVTVLGNTGSLANTGYSFAGWNTQAGGGGTSYASGDTFAMGSANVTLYAQWLSTASLTISLNNPSDSTATLQVDGVNITTTPSLSSGDSQSLTVTVSNSTYTTYLWTVSGDGTLPTLSNATTSSATITTVMGATSIAVFRVTLWFGNGSYQYSKSFSIQVTE